MNSKLVLMLIGCVLAGTCCAQAAPAKQKQIYLDWTQGARYFDFPAGAQAKVTDVNCPTAAQVSVTCRTASRGRCGSWYLNLNDTATAGPGAAKGVAAVNYSGPRGSNCTATLVVQSP